MNPSTQLQVEQLVQAVRQMHEAIRRRVVSACETRSVEDLSGVTECSSSETDTIYRIDRVGEQELLDFVAAEIAGLTPVVVIGEGIKDGHVVCPKGTPASKVHWRIIVDPIDGTRGLMFQKRSAWILTGIAPNYGDATSFGDIEAAVQTEIPLVKQHLCDQLWAVRGQGAQAVRWNRVTGESASLKLAPSRAVNLLHGYATVCRFFPGARDVLAAIDDELATRLLGPRKTGDAHIFEDQYSSTAGQLYGLMVGQDRFVADLRPLTRQTLEARGEALGHCCHPYDICTALIAEEAGIVVRGAEGQSLACPLDTTTNVTWIGYANQALAKEIEPVLGDILRERGWLTPSIRKNSR
ncbi:MAG: hypothetical protein MK161_09265 [Pirellulales bacterium]|nr:hypothetical protein [Pirellulales bacterium]